MNFYIVTQLHQYKGKNTMQVIAIAMLLFAAFLTCSNCDLEVQTSLTGSEVDESHDILLYSGDDQGPVVDSQGGGALLHNGGGPDKQDYVDMEPMLDPEADFDGYEKYGDYVILKRNYMKRYRRGAKRLRSKRLILKWVQKWENGIIPYYITEENYTALEVNLIIKAMAHWEEKTCIRFKKQTTESDYVLISPGSGCYSLIGRQGGQQGLILSPSCFWEPEVVIHELGHLIGFFHEHTRPDRNEHIQVNYDNIKIGTDRKQFDAKNGSIYDTLGVAYDYNSIMHYDAVQSAADNRYPTIEALDKNIPVGLAVELTELDILKTKIYYNCSAIPPPRMTFYTPLPEPATMIPPRTYECGEFIDGNFSGTIATPKYPLYQSEMCCSWQIRVPSGFRIKLHINSFGLKDRPGTTCDDGNITMHQYLDSQTGRYPLIKRCIYRTRYDKDYYYTWVNEASIEYCSGNESSNDPPMGFNMSFTAIDINECSELMKCSHECVNTPGGYTCRCPKGFSLSADRHNCFDINECAFHGTMCEYKCRNRAGHFHCVCPDGSIQTNSTCYNPSTVSDEEHTISSTETTSTMTMPPSTTITTEHPTTMTTDHPTTMTTDHPTTIPPTTITTDHPTTNPPTTITTDHPTTLTTDSPTTIPPTTITTDGPTTMTTDSPTTISPTTITTDPPTRMTTDRQTTMTTPPPTISPPPPVATPPYTVFDSLNGKFTTPNWPETYPVNIDLQWLISCPSDSIVELNFREAPFGIAGRMPSCTKDWVRVHDGSQKGIILEQFCYLNMPPVIMSTSSNVLVEFHAGPEHGPTRKGFSASYKCVQQCSPIALPTLPQCGFHTNSDSGVISTPNWPLTYNVNEYCEWIIELPDCKNVVEVTFTDFSVAGKMEDCLKDQV